jgi:hypothetical protein
MLNIGLSKFLIVSVYIKLKSQVLPQDPGLGLFFFITKRINYIYFYKINNKKVILRLQDKMALPTQNTRVQEN